jgi:hypothetical protein
VVPSTSVCCSYISVPSGAWWRRETACSCSAVVSGSSMRHSDVHRAVVKGGAFPREAGAKALLAFPL